MQRLTAILILLAMGGAAHRAEASSSAVDACLEERGLLRIARVIDSDGKAVYARVDRQRGGHIERATAIAPANAPLSSVFARAAEASGPSFAVSDDRVCAVVDLPEAEIDAERRVLVSTGLNYAAHAEEAGGGDVFLFPKPSEPTSAYSTVHAPSGVTLLDYEVELAFVLLGDVDPYAPPSRSELLERSAFFLTNDVSDREAIIEGAALSGPGTGFAAGKGQPGFLPAGPWMVRGSELFGALEACGQKGLGLRLWIDDEAEPRQDATTELMILRSDQLIGRIASWMDEHGRRSTMPFRRPGESSDRYYPFAVPEEAPVLPAGSIVQTGTPEGVAMNAPSPLGVALRGLMNLRGPFAQFLSEEKERVAAGGTRYLAPGQIVRAQIDGLGEQRFSIGEAGGRPAPDPCTRGGHQ